MVERCETCAFLHKRRGELVIQRDRAMAAHLAEVTRLYDTLAAINDSIEVGGDGYARFGSLNDRDLFRDVVRTLEDRALATHNAPREGRDDG